MKSIFAVALSVTLLSSGSIAANAQQDSAATLRAPATPLVTHDPYFSIWSTADRLTDGTTRHWTGVPQAINGIVRVDG